ncbi:MAG: general secretion pathway protein GspK [Lentisphaeria bacterium]|nr:general secretion pathway protein GspK [Lentisphaeria bacterium]
MSAHTGNGNRHESGMTLILTLGFLCLMMVIMLTMAITSNAERKASSMNTASVRVQLLAESAVQRAVQQVCAGDGLSLYPADNFITPSESSAWHGQRVLASRNPYGSSGDIQADIKQALCMNINGLQVTPEATVDGAASWIPIKTKQYKNGTNETVLTGRYAFVVLDDSGKIDPAAVVSRVFDEDGAEGAEEDGDEPKTGFSTEEIDLGDLGFSNTDRFRPSDTQDNVQTGVLPEVGRWFSLGHLIKGVEMSQAEAELCARTLTTSSFDVERFWRDRNNDGKWDIGEDADRLNMVAITDASKPYQLFVGAAQEFGSGDVGQDDCAWLKSLDNADWFNNWKMAAFSQYAEPERTNRARCAVAAQVAVNLVDYIDADSIPTTVYVGNDGQVHLGTSSGSMDLHGVERNWGISQVTMRVQSDVTVSGGSTGSGSTDGSGGGSDDVPFEVVAGEVVPGVEYTVSATVLGAQLGVYNFGYDPPQFLYWCPITTQLNVGSETFEPWGDFEPNNTPQVNNSDINDGNNPRTFDVPGTFPAGTAISLDCNFYWEVNNQWSKFCSLSSDQNTDRVRVLRDGDPVPTVTANTDNQEDAAYFMQDYISDGVISLQPNQAIYLFETNTTSSYAGQDFQDVVLLLNMTGTGESNTTTTITKFAAQGLCNINPNNHDEFSITLNSATLRTRDDLHQYGEGYTGPITAMHVRPKGNANNNTLMLNGVVFPLQNSTTYDFTGDMQVHLYNDRYTNGKAMGRWWIGMEGDNVTVVENNQTYFETVEETVDPGTNPDNDPDAGDEGNNLKVCAGFKVELFHPFEIDFQVSHAPTNVTVRYLMSVTGVTGASFTYQGTRDIVLDTAANVDGGTLLWNSTFSDDEWLTLMGAFDRGANPALDGYTISLARIISVTVTDNLGAIADKVPVSGSFLAQWGSPDLQYADEMFYASATAVDPLMNDRGSNAPDFHLFWTVVPADGTLTVGAALEPTGVGDIINGYASNPYSNIDVKNSGVARVGEIGRVHSYIPLQSLRLWSASTADEDQHDAKILDLFKIGTGSQTRGKVNINTLQPAVLKALFTGVVPDPEAAADAILAKRAQGVTFTNIGEVFGAISELTPTDATQDIVAERVATLLVEKLTTRQNYFTVLVTAQAIKDVAGVPYLSDGENKVASYGELDVVYKDGKVVRYIDKIVAERKLVATVYRDAFTNRTKVERIEFLNE